MKKLLILLALAAPAFAQTPATPATTPATTTTAPAGKPKPLAPPDKQFVKNALDGMYYVMELSGKTKDKAKADGVKKLGSTLKSDLDKMWADVGGLASDRGEQVPTKLSGGDKQKSERLGKEKDAEKFDKEYTKLVTKELEKLARVFETASKTGTEPAVKELGAKWAATLKEHATAADTAEKEAMKAK